MCRSFWTMVWACVLVFGAFPAQAEITVNTTSIAHGVRAWYAENDTVPVVDVVLSFEGAGTTSDPEGKGGRAAFAAAMLTEGAGAFDSAAFQRALDDGAITLEAQVSDDRLTVHVHCLRENAERAGELLALALGHPQLNDADAARVKTQMITRLSLLDESPEYHASRLLEQRAFAGHPYANPAYGTAASVAVLGGQDVRDYLKTYVTRGNLVISAAGDVDGSLLDDMLTPAIDALADNDAGAVPATQVAMQGGGEILRQSMAVPQSIVHFAAPAIARDDPRFYAAYLLNHILGGNALVSRLSDEVRQQKGLAYSVETGFDLRRGTSLITGTLATRNSQADAALGEVKTVLTTLFDKGVTTEECADAKSYVLGSLPLQLDSSASVAGTLQMMQIYRLGTDYLDEREALFKKVNCADINALAAELLQPQRFLVTIVGGTADTPENAASTVAPTGSDIR